MIVSRGVTLRLLEGSRSGRGKTEIVVHAAVRKDHASPGAVALVERQLVIKRW